MLEYANCTHSLNGQYLGLTEDQFLIHLHYYKTCQACLKGKMLTLHLSWRAKKWPEIVFDMHVVFLL